MDYYKVYCNNQYKECKHDVDGGKMKDDFSKGSLSFGEESWTLTKGKPRLLLSMLKLTVENNFKKKFEFSISDINEYSYQGFYKGEPIDYKRIFIFFDITSEIETLNKFSYKILYKGEMIQGPFNFLSNVAENMAKPKIVSIGYHDTSVYGALAIEKLASFHYDLLVIPGNIGLEIQEDGFRHMENYFDRMQKNFTSAPVMMMPGGHESVDNFELFNTKFQALSLKNYREMDAFHCYINEVSLYFLNLTLITQNVHNFPGVFKKFTQVLSSVGNQETKHNKNPKWRILISNEPLFCSGISLDNEKCLKNMFLLKSFHDIARSFGIDVFLTGGTSYYERDELPDFEEFRKWRKENVQEEVPAEPHASGKVKKIQSFQESDVEMNDRDSESVVDNTSFFDEDLTDSILNTSIMTEDLTPSDQLPIKKNSQLLKRSLRKSKTNNTNLVIKKNRGSKGMSNKKLHLNRRILETTTPNDSIKQKNSESNAFYLENSTNKDFTFLNDPDIEKFKKSVISKQMNSFESVNKSSENDNGVWGFLSKEKIESYLSAFKPLFKMKGPSYIINVGSAGYSKGYTPVRLNSDSNINKNKKTAIKGFVLLTFLNRDSRLFYIDFKNLEIQDFILIGEKTIKLTVLKYFLIIFISLGFFSVCLYSNAHTVKRVGQFFKITKNPNNFEYLLYQQEKVANQLREEDKIEKMIQTQREFEKQEAIKHKANQSPTNEFDDNVFE